MAEDTVHVQSTTWLHYKVMICAAAAAVVSLPFC